MADKELEKVRAKFEENVTKKVIKQLIHELLEDGVLEKGEAESITAENSTADEARSLIDNVRRKGNEASRKMILDLQIIAPFLYYTLGLSHIESVQYDKQHLTMRTKFADTVSEDIINELEFYLSYDDVLTAWVTVEMVRKNSTRAKQARGLINTVKSKGAVACRRMIKHLKNIDSDFFDTLGLTLEDPPVSEPKEQSWSDTLQKTTPTFWMEQRKNSDNYLVTKESIRNRVALLITNIEFKYQKNRNGAKKDEEIMANLLSSLGYEVVKHTNLSGKEIDGALISFSQHSKLAHTDSVFIVIMSHGKLGAVCGVNHTKEQPDEFPIDNIYKHLGTRNCPSLEDKPKVIIIQACRGEGTGSVLVCDDGNAAVTSDAVPLCSQQPSAEGGDIEDDSWKIKHNEKDFTSLLSSTPDNKSYRHTIDGSIMIQSTVKVFNTYACNKHIEELITSVINDVSNFSSGEKMQIPTKDRTTLLKNFYLYPGI